MQGGCSSLGMAVHAFKEEDEQGYAPPPASWRIHVRMCAHMHAHAHTCTHIARLSWQLLLLPAIQLVGQPACLGFMSCLLRFGKKKAEGK